MFKIEPILCLTSLIHDPLSKQKTCMQKEKSNEEETQTMQGINAQTLYLYLNSF